MSISLRRLRRDHRNVEIVLALIEEQVDRATCGVEPDMALLNAAIAYFREYFTVFHQPKEEIIFGHLVGHVKNFAHEIFPLLDDHRALACRVDELERALKAVNGADQAALKDFIAAARSFIRSQREHLSAEERYFYPDAERILSGPQWAEVDRYLPGAQDPLSQVPPSAVFAPLARAVRVERALTQAEGEGAHREVVGIFDQPEDLQAAIDELLQSGFHRAELSLLSSVATVDRKLGHRFQKVQDLADDAAVPRVAYVSTEAIGDAEGALIGTLMYVGALTAAGAAVASGGALASLIVAAAVAGGSGGLLGAILARWVGHHHARHLQAQLDRGGLLLWVLARNDGAERCAVNILEKHSGVDVHAHTFPGTPDPAIRVNPVSAGASHDPHDQRPGH